MKVLNTISAGTLRDPQGKISEISAAFICVVVRKIEIYNMVKSCYSAFKALQSASSPMKQ